MGSWMTENIDYEQEMHGVQCILDHVTDDIMRISRYIDFLVDDINYLTDTDNTLNITDFDLSFDLHRIQKLFINFKDKYKGELRL